MASNFDTITNGVDNNLKIIIHKETGFYNITKINNAIYELKKSKNEPRGILPGSIKQIRHWFDNKINKELIEDIKKEYELMEVKYILNDVNDDYKGTYVHPYLFDFIVAWIDTKYAIRIAKIIHFEHDKVNKYKDNKINNLEEQLEQLLKYAKDSKNELGESRKELKKIINQNDDLLSQNDELLKQNDSLEDSVEDLKEDIGVVKEVLKDKSYHSTIDPKNQNKVHHFAVIRNIYNSKETKILRAQKSTIEKELKKYKDDYKIIIPISYNANAIDLFHNAVQKYKEYIEKLIKVRREHNIRARVKKNNLQRLPSIRKSEIPIKFTTTMILYENNDYVSYDTLINIIKDMNKETQTPPEEESE